MNPGVSTTWLDQFHLRLLRFFVYLSSVSLCFMALMIFIDVTLRYIFNSPLAASVEISQLIEPWVIFLPFAYTLAIGGHVRVTLITMHLSTKWRLVFDVFAYIIDLIFFAILCWFSWLEFAHSYAINEIMMAAIKLPWWAGKLSMPIGIFLISLQCIFQIVSTVRKIKRGNW